MANANRLSPSIHLPSGSTDAGHPYIGSATPRLSITEFADYQCPHCANAHVEMRELVAKNPGTICIVHWHFCWIINVTRSFSCRFTRAPALKPASSTSRSCSRAMSRAISNGRP